MKEKKIVDFNLNLLFFLIKYISSSRNKGAGREASKRGDGDGSSKMLSSVVFYLELEDKSLCHFELYKVKQSVVYRECKLYHCRF